MNDLGGRNRLTKLIHELLEKITVFGLLDGRELGAEQLDAKLIKYTGRSQLSGHIEASLTPQGGDDGVGVLPPQN